MKARATSATADDGGYLASVSDLMSGLIFIFIIALVTFAIGLRQQQSKHEAEIARLRGAAEERNRLLERIRDDLAQEKIEVTIDYEQGVLRLGERILFDTGLAELDENGRNAVDHIAAVLMNVLPCYTTRQGQSVPETCGDRGKAGRVDALFIEGHTDNVPITGGSFRDNWDLSTARAKAIFLRLTSTQPELDVLLNQDRQAVLGVSGYADRRGVESNDTDDHRKLNRRIDLRFVMAPPRELVRPAAETKAALP